MERVNQVNIIQAIKDKDLFLPLFGELTTWKNWLVCLKAIFALPLTEEEREIYFKFTKRTRVPEKLFKEIFLIIGRRGGKSFISAIIGVFLALFKDWSPYLKGGELGWIFVIASDRDQARVVHNHIKYILEEQFRDMIDHETKSQIFLTNNIVIEVRAASWRGVRGYTIVAAICDELGFWRSDESANPGKEIIGALRPGMVTIKESMMIGISTPYARKGVLWDAFHRKYGKNDSRTIVWKAPTLDMNPTVDVEVIKEDMEKDPSFAMAEWYAEFRKDVESPFDPEDIADVTRVGHKQSLPNAGIQYRAFVDPSGGKVDSFTLAIAHEEMGKVILDRLEEVKAPHDPKTVTQRFCRVLKEYNCYQVVGDKFSGNWCANEFRDNGVRYISTEISKSEIYIIFQTMMMSKIVELLDLDRLSTQLQNLERRVHTGGRDTIDHPRGLHDDVANAAAGVAVVIYKNLKIGLNPEYMAQRLPTAQGKEYTSLTSEYEKQAQRVLDKVRGKGEASNGI